PVPADYHGSMTDYAALKKAGAPVLGWGAFVTDLVSFVIFAFIVFLMIKAANKAMRKGPDAPAGPSEVELLAEIRDELRKRASSPWPSAPSGRAGSAKRWSPAVPVRLCRRHRVPAPAAGAEV